MPVFDYMSVAIYISDWACTQTIYRTTCICLSALLRGERASLLKVIDATEQELELSISGARLVLGDFCNYQHYSFIYWWRRTMTRPKDGAKGQATLSVCGTHDTTTAIPDVGSVGAAMSIPDQGIGVRDEERLSGRRLEALGAVPGHVLDGDDGTVQEEEVVVPAVADEDVVSALDDGRERPEGAGNRAVSVGKDDVVADSVVGGRDVDGRLDIGAVEVVVRTAAQRGEAHLVPQEGAEIGQVVDVEARVDKGLRRNDVAPDRAALGASIRHSGEVLGRREGQSLLEELVVAALFGTLVDVLHSSVVEIEDAGEVIQRRDGRH